MRQTLRLPDELCVWINKKQVNVDNVLGLQFEIIS
jgi:hypothetical protein